MHANINDAKGKANYTQDNSFELPCIVILYSIIYIHMFRMLFTAL